MATEVRKTGVDAVGDVVSWGAHETKEDLLTDPGDDSVPGGVAFCFCRMGNRFWPVSRGRLLNNMTTG
jgi:hypothetical protein